MTLSQTCTCNSGGCSCGADFASPSFLDQSKLKSKEDKILSGETVCNVDSPEDCENCGS